MNKAKKTPKRNVHGKPIVSSGHDIAVTSSQWYGAAVFYLLNLGKVPMKELKSKRIAHKDKQQ